MSDKKSSNEDLLNQINDAIAKAEVAAVNANAAAATANSAADQASSGAAAGVAGARTQSNTEQASGTEALLKSVSQHIDSDINIPEAWSVNAKRTYDLHQSLDLETTLRNRHHFDTLVTEQQKHLSNLNNLTLQSLANNQNQSNLCNLLGIDRSWNVNETDAFSVLLNKVVSDAVAAEMAKQKPA